jgi:ABC-type Fe3+-hydroxamate transport system substrate-binding protein
MRFPLVARRIILAPVLGLALALAVAACSSSSSSSSSSAAASSAPASSAPASSSGPAASGNSAAAAQITTNWEKFFNASTPLSQRVALLQNGSTFSSAIDSFSKLPLANGIGAKVTGVTVTSPTMATVTYSIVSGSTTLLGGQSGTAVNQDGTWKVGDASLCNLFKLIPGGSVPAACSSAG